MGTIFIQILHMLMALALLVVIHESGHFLFAKLFKVRVEKFCLFFDPWLTLLKLPKKPKEGKTQFCLGWLPLGGYVKIAGMIDESLDREQMAQPPKPWEFRSKPAWQRLLIMIGGVLFNFLLAIIIYAMILFAWGETSVASTTPELGLDFSPTAQAIGFKNGDILLEADGTPIEDEANSIILPRRGGWYNNVSILRDISNARVVKVKRNGSEAYVHLTDEMGQRLIMDSMYFATYRYPAIIDSIIQGPAMDAGMAKGDKIIAINNQPAHANSDVFKAIANCKANDTISVTYIRGNEEQTASIILNDDKKMNVIFTGLPAFTQEAKKNYSLLASFPAGIRLGVNTLGGYVNDIKYVFTKEGAQSIGGFGTITQLFPKLWDWHRFWEMAALLSIIFAFMNILPIPALDGGHVLFLFYEIITRRKPSDKFLEYAQMTGMVLLFALLIWANFNDIIRALF